MDFEAAAVLQARGPPRPAGRGERALSRALRPGAISRQYVRYDRGKETDPATQLLLLFCKVNAGEAFGVEVMREARKAYFDRGEHQYQAEKIIANEEEYHTKLLLGATQYFGVTMNEAFVRRSLCGSSFTAWPTCPSGSSTRCCSPRSCPASTPSTRCWT